ncbi:MAG: DUF4880 domain-containing protein, partial [Haliea sp.]
MSDDFHLQALPAEARVLDEAAAWLTHLHSGAATDADRQAHQDWCHRHPSHAEAWHKAQRLLQSLQGLPAGLGKTAFTRRPSASRRMALGKLAALMVVAPGTAWMAWKTLPFLEWSADLRTATGEQRTVTLADGSQLMLNTGTSVDVRFSEGQRLLLLRAGEVLVQTASDSAPVARPFLVQTPHGSVRALGTRFTVREHAHATQVGVIEHAVEITTGSGSRRRLEAGEQARYDASRIDSATPLEGAADWTRPRAASRCRCGWRH